jgi:hypothetical protein
MSDWSDGTYDTGDDVSDTGTGGGGGTGTTTTDDLPYTGDPDKYPGFDYNPQTGTYTRTQGDGSTVEIGADGSLIRTTGDTYGTAKAGLDAPAIDKLAQSLPEQAWNAIKSAFTKKTQKIGADGKPIPNEFDESVDWKALAAAGGGIAGLATNLMNKDKPAPITGYQGKIPTLNAVQQQVPGTYDPTRRPGSSGQRYLTDMKYAAPSDAAAAQTSAGEQATGLAALNAANPAMQKIQKSPEGKVIPDSMVSKPYAAPASSVIDRLAPTMKGLASLTDAKNVITSTDDGWKMPLNKESAPTDIMAAVKAANPNLDWSKYNPNKMTMDYDQFDAARDNYMKAANPTFNQNKESDMAKAANAAQNAQSGGIGSITPPNQTVAQPAAPGKYDSPTAQNPNPGMIAIDDPVYRKGNSSNFLSSLFDASKRTPNPNAQPITYEDNYASGGGITALKGGNYLSGPTDGMADKLPANIEGNQEARLSHGEFVIPADVVSHLGNGNSDAGAERLYSMMDKIRKARTGTKKQGKQINPNKFLPGGSVGYAEGGDVKHFLTGGVTGTTTGTTTANPAITGQESNLSNWAGDYVTNMLGKGQALADQPYQGYSGPLTAGASAGQTAAFQGAAGLNVPTGQMGAFTPQTFTADQAQNYMNPYLSAALNPQMEEMRRQSQLNLQPNMAKLTQAGGYGGSRQALLQSESNRNLQTQQNAALGQGYQTAFDKAMGQFNTEQNRGLEAQSATNAYGLQALSKQAELGGQQRDIEQQGITADKAQFEEEKQDPYKKLTFQQSLLQGLPVQAQSNQYAQPSLLNSLAGGATTIAELYDILFPQAKTTPGTTSTTTAVKV